MSLTGRGVAKLAVLKGWKEVRVKGRTPSVQKGCNPYNFYDSNSWKQGVRSGFGKENFKRYRATKKVFMLKSYPEIFHKEEDGSFWVEFPGFCGGTEGDDVEEAMKNAREMLESSLAAYLDEGLELLKVADVSELSVENGFITLIQADPSPYLKSTKAIRKNVTVPEWLIRLADREHVNYSEALTQTL